MNLHHLPQLRHLTALLLLTGASLLSLPSCQRSGSSATSQVADSLTQEERDDFAQEVTFSYAKRLSVENHPDYKLVTIHHPDEAKDLARYILYPRGAKKPELQADAYIEVPLRSIACLSTSQVGALPLLGAVDQLVGVSDLNLLNDEEILTRVKEGKIQVIGQGMSKNYEAIAALRPDALLVSFFSEDSQEAELSKTGIHVLLDYEWKEETLLGRAEWLKFLGMLLGKNAVATKHFSQIEADYRATLDLVKQAGAPLPTLYGLDYQGAWYLPGEKSYVADLLTSAGLRTDVTPGAVSGQPAPFEQVIARHRQDSLWICMPPNDIKTIQAFSQLHARYADFTAVRSGRVLVPNKRVNATGGNDFWQTGVYEPNLQVKDLVFLTRPDLLPSYTPKYWIALQR